MRRARLLWQIYPSYVLVILAVLLIVGWFAYGSLQEVYYAQLRDSLRVRAQLVEDQVVDRFDTQHAEELQTLCQRIGEQTSTRITLVLPSGKVLCDTEQDPAEAALFADQPEIRQALAGEMGAQLRLSRAENQRLVHVAIPVRNGGAIVGAVRASASSAGVDAALAHLVRNLVAGGLLMAAVAGSLSLYLTWRIGQPLGAMRSGAVRFAQGDFGYKLTVPNSEELGGLAEALNQMADQLRDRIGTIVRQGNEQQAVLASMAEGVLAVDTRERMISLNGAAAELLGTSAEEALGRSLAEVIRNADLRRFVTSALVSNDAVDGDVVLHIGGDRVLQAHGTALRDAQGHSVGAVIVLNDVTRLRRLESLRRDFVANVSHELKTPITSIKGFVETLLDGALANPKDAERFLRIIAKQADRLNAIIEDLLSLSKIEQEAEAAEIVLEEGRIKDVLDAAMHDCNSRSAERNIAVRLECDPHLTARINPRLLEQAVANLLDNAIKYSEPGQEVKIVAAGNPSEANISVSDQGCGIAAEHLPRVFERFYRVDKARSRKAGGTGLGLAIVKHIVHAHGGKITVESTPGHGSTFSIHLPVC